MMERDARLRLVGVLVDVMRRGPLASVPIRWPCIMQGSSAKDQYRWPICYPNRTMLPRSSDTDGFWRGFQRHAGIDHNNYVVGSFGDSSEMATELAELVIAGIKRATASLARDYDNGGEPMPKPGDFVMMLDGEGCPRFIWRTTEIMIKPLSEVDEAFAWDEG